MGKILTPKKLISKNKTFSALDIFSEIFYLILGATKICLWFENECNY